ncbi:MAG: hypothetical protein JWO03_1156 [Bacteroidetes bacterium]|nr:hypothetical protein [Bacteroidota bacterium]
MHKSIYDIINRIPKWLPIGIGMLAALYGILTPVIRYFFPTFSLGVDPFLSTLFGLILSGIWSLNYKSEELFERVGVTDFEIIRKDDIRYEVKKALKEMKYYLRVTSFKESYLGPAGDKDENVSINKIRQEEKEKSDDTVVSYYKQLFKLLKRKDIKYYCFINEDHPMINRKEAFNSCLLSEKDRIKIANNSYYYEVKNQVYFNFMIVDDKVAFLAFPVNAQSSHHDLMLKITANSDKSKKLINDLIMWYTNFLLHSNTINKTQLNSYGIMKEFKGKDPFL